jgi:class 3 adenylate cyclase/tetratricopeptide (TPR) repeat protein
MLGQSPCDRGAVRAKGTAAHLTLACPCKRLTLGYVATCPSCGKELPAGDFPFCPFCTAALSEVEREAAFEERKVVSVLFCDLVGFTAASEAADPEDVRARIRPYHRRLREEIEGYGGTVEKFVGDAVMAVFGAPVAHEDDAERAVRAGLRILEAIVELNESEPALSLQVRVGINTGEAVVALDARPEQGEGIVAGDVVNTASRLQGAAPVNGIAVSEQTYRATDRVFDYEQLDAVFVKGKAEPIRLWRPLAARARLGTDTTRRYRTQFVGRELEKALLIGMFERAVQQRSLQLVTIIGEPGVGKSRLVAELFRYVDKKPSLTRWRQGRCLPYGEGITFWALGEIVKAEAGVLESDSSQTAWMKLQEAVPPDEPERQWLLQRLAPLVGVEAASSAERQELFTAWRRFLEGLAGNRPTVLVFEDLHWADEALLAFLEHLAEWSQGVPLLVVCTARPELNERHSGWAGGMRNATTINLPPLSDSETAELVSNLAAATVLSDELERTVLEQAGGNPLYAEEFVRLLADRGIGPGEVEVPESVQALIAARLDTLASEKKAVIQDAAVLGKVFWVGALAEIGGRGRTELELALHELARKELVRPARVSSVAGETEYSFWHLLVRDVAYAQIPRAERVRRHRAAASWIERRGGERVEDLAEVLAYHYLQALELAEALGDRQISEETRGPARRFLALAGERALGLDTLQAKSRLERALELVAPNDPERPLLLIRWAEATFQSGGLREAADALDQALAALGPDGNPEARAEALQLRSQVALLLGEGRHVELAEEAVDLLDQEPRRPALIAAYTQLAHVQFLSGHYTEAIATADRARSLSRTFGVAEPARALGYYGAARARLGEADGLTELEQAVTLLVEQGAGREAGRAQGNLAIGRYAIHGPAAALAAFEEGIVFCEQRGLVELAAHLESNCPLALAELGRTQDSLDRVAKCALALEASSLTHALIEPRAVELTLRVARGERGLRSKAEWLVQTVRKTSAADTTATGLAAAAGALVADSPEEACALLSELEQTAGTRETPYYPGQLPAMLRTAITAGALDLAAQLAHGIELSYPIHEHALCSARAQLAEANGDHAEAADVYGEAAERWQQFGNVPERAYALLGRGRCLVAATGLPAQVPLTEARDLLADMSYTLALDQTERLLAQAAAPSAS